MTPGEPSVSGGKDGVDAHLDDMEKMSGLITGLGGDMTGLALVGHRYLADPNVIASALLDPAGAARFEWTMLRALDGDRGLSGVAIAIGVSGVKLRVAAVTYRATDQLQASLMDAAEFVYAPVTLIVSVVEVGVLTGAHMLLDGDSLPEALQRTITDHPGIVDQVVGSVPGVLAALAVLSPLAAGGWIALGMPTTVPTGAAGLARLYPDGRPVVTSKGPDESAAARHPPESLADVIRGLNDRNAADDGEIDVRIVETIGPDGRVHLSAIVDIPGTKVWNLPGAPSGSIQDLGTNLHGVANDTTSYERAVALALDRAMGRAGVAASDRGDVPVMLVGHSQGGIVAAHAAGSFADSGRYNVTHVVTAGSPIGEVEIPEAVQVLSIENRHDVIPHADSQSNPDRSNRTTVVVDQQHGNAGDNHGIRQTYLPAAGVIDDSDDPSVRAFLDSAGHFLGGDRVTTDRFGVTRAP